MSSSQSLLRIDDNHTPARSTRARAFVRTLHLHLAELSYTHFTVSMDTVRRIAAVTAVNIDGSKLRNVKRSDNWQLDNRLLRNQQAGPELYAKNDIDRDHIVRRIDRIVNQNVFAQEIPPLGAYRTYQVPVEDIAEVTGLTMPDLVDADRLTAVPTARPIEWTELHVGSDLVF
ncbi:DNA/RNA non-specific endonuclease [Rhodococcus sovatensis]|uniref:DNA/RNA non-specific endonuclease n=1 Tax=Rhodococcus sovatensis TaxID=1805840 RepID=A0ABZ2PD99_9NOCA